MQHYVKKLKYIQVDCTIECKSKIKFKKKIISECYVKFETCEKKNERAKNTKYKYQTFPYCFGSFSNLRSSFLGLGRLFILINDFILS